MNNLQGILVVLSVIVIAISTWGIMYFVGRVIIHYYIRRHLGDMPSAEEIAKLYEENNAIITYKYWGEGTLPHRKEK